MAVLLLLLTDKIDCLFVCLFARVPLCKDEALVHHDRDLLHGVQFGEVWGPVLSCSWEKKFRDHVV